MQMRALVGFLFLVLVSSVVSAQERPLCHDWMECRQFAVKAYADGDYESFYDFARRSLAAGPPRDAKLLLLVARAESLTGRVDDAKRTLERLARMGVKVDVAGNDDFKNVRVAEPASSSAAAVADKPAEAVASPVAPTSSAPAAPASASPSALPAPPAPNAPVDVALRLPATRISPTGLAYDHVSGRFLLADRDGHKLVSVDELSRHMVDLVKADSAGFREITAFEIDPRRGDLWVVSAGAGGGAGGGSDHDPGTALHKLQLVSGRPLARFLPGDGFGEVRFQDVGVTKSGDVFVLDGTGGRIFRLAPRSTTLRVAFRVPFDSPISLALDGERAAFVAFSGGLARIDLVSGQPKKVVPSANVRLDGLERIRWDNGHIVGTQRLEDGTRHVVSIRIAGGASPRATGIKQLDSVDVVAGGTLTAISGDDVYFLTRESGHGGEDGEFVVHRTRLP
jgi:hypothetical protein